MEPPSTAPSGSTPPTIPPGPTGPGSAREPTRHVARRTRTAIGASAVAAAVVLAGGFALTSTTGDAAVADVSTGTGSPVPSTAPSNRSTPSTTAPTTRSSTPSTTAPRSSSGGSTGRTAPAPHTRTHAS